MGQAELAESVRQRLAEEFPDCVVAVEADGEEHVSVRVESGGKRWERRLQVPFYEQSGAVGGVVRMLRLWVLGIRD